MIRPDLIQQCRILWIFCIVQCVAGILKVNILLYLQKAAELLCEKDQKIQNRIQNRLNQLLSDATIETRAEKLCEIIKTKYAMETISYVDINFYIKPKKMQQFIDLRNHFFHGAKSNDADRNAVATNELLRLCMAIFQKEVENA